MKFLVLGAGFQGSACAYDLLRNEPEAAVLLADISVDRLPPFLEEFRGDPRLEIRRVDATDEDAVSAAMAEVDACLNALPYYFNLRITQLAVRAGVHYADLGGNTEIVRAQLELDDEARARRISVIPDCGLAPGMVTILAEAGIRELADPSDVRIRVGGLPQEPQPPLNYQIVYSLEGVLDYYTTPSWILRDGEPVEVGALEEVEPVEFPPPLGTLEAFHTAGGVSLLPWKYEGKLRSIEYKTLRYPGHAELMRAIRSLGLLELDPVRVKDVDVVPRDAFIAVVKPRLQSRGAPDVVALQVEVTGAPGSSPRRIVYDLVDRFDESTGISAMERTTGFSLAITGHLQASGAVERMGVSTPDDAVPADEYVNALRRRGVLIQKHVE